MSENIKVSEVSDILRHQLEGIDTRVQLDEIGTVTVWHVSTDCVMLKQTNCWSLTTVSRRL